MNEISNEVRAVEIHQKATSYYQASEQFAYKFLMEIKILRDEKLYKELGYEDFESYTLDNFGYSRETITNRIQSAEALGLDYDEALRHFGKTKTRLLGLMPEPEREQALKYGIPTDNGIKSIEEATTREIERYQKKEQQLNKRINLQSDIINQKNDTINKQAEEVRKLKQLEPKVVTKTVEKFPEDYEKIKQENEQLKQSNQKLQRDLKWVGDDLSLTQTQYNLLESSTAEAKELERKIQSLQSQEKTIVEKMEAVETFYELERNFNEFFDTKMAPMRFKGIANHLYATNAVDRIRTMITQAELWAEEMNKILPNKNMKILEGEIIDD